MKTPKLVQMVDELDIEMCWISERTHGNIDLKTNHIKLNVETMVVEVFVHEVMHLLHPLLNRKKDEDVIDTLTSRFYKELTPIQVRIIAKKLLRRFK